MSNPPETVTVIISQRVKVGREGEYQAWVRGISDVASRFPGHMGVQLMSPVSSEQPEHVVIFRFASYPDLVRWESSAELADWLRRAKPFMEETVIQRISGLEGWFSLPGRGQAPPPRWKMALLTGAVIWVLVTLLQALTSPVLASLVLPLRTLLTAAVLVVLMTYVVMPRVSRLFSGWLYG